jgi:hypothetical protein
MVRFVSEAEEFEKRSYVISIRKPVPRRIISRNKKKNLGVFLLDHVVRSSD